jgi:prepilin-type N-terminal cleavage/methylation domain-containing protein/prepilin-type processing-associated H-X9-DG protein
MAMSSHLRDRDVRAFTLIELLVVISIIGLLVSILLPALAQSRSAARNVQCKSNLKGWGTMMAAYHADHKQQYPMAVTHCVTVGVDVAPGYYNSGRTFWSSLNAYSQILKGGVTFNTNRRYSRTALQCSDVEAPPGAIRDYYTHPNAAMPSVGGASAFNDYGLPQYAMNAGFGVYDYYSSQPSFTWMYTWKGHLRDTKKPSSSVAIMDAHVAPYSQQINLSYYQEAGTGPIGVVYGPVMWAFMPPHVSRPDLTWDGYTGARGGYRHAQSLNAVHLDGHVSEYGESKGSNAERNAADKARFTMDTDVFPGYAAGWQSSYVNGLP